MFEAKLANAALLKKIIESIKDLVTDAPFDCSESAMCLQAMDSSHVALVSLKLEVGLFDTYRCDRTINLGMSLANMSKALKCANNDDTCMIKFEEGDSDSITFTFADIKRDKTQVCGFPPFSSFLEGVLRLRLVTKEYFIFYFRFQLQDVTVKMMDIDSEHLGIPEQDYAVVCEMPSSEFQKTCKDLSMFSDSLNITATKAGIVFTGKEVTDPVNVNFSIKYMNQFTKATSLSSRVRISLCNDVPIVVEYPLTDDGKATGQQNGHLRFYLAPKIDDEDNMD
ncbi:unnamed protein product [Angiostrongylus costaricensis]|uniref:DNA sliding clamp PCNA n=1 Tax=Angiostrongylus costaricensis TaxID=334426 RepID=A0A0R3PJI7_ANGCS|nr:unnamed protein product [Angiostrongylus costaricensis]